VWEDFDAFDDQASSPTAAELASLAWQLSRWWDDRDRIMLLNERLLAAGWCGDVSPT
jgi:hypothetical protein